MGQRIETASSNSIADIAVRIPRGTGQMLTLNQFSSLAPTSPMQAQWGRTK